jgi:hypothetical protein
MPSNELFELAPPLLSWLPGETLFSLISRQHAFWGRPTSGETAKVLFGRRHAGIHHDFPNGLDEFSRRTGGVFGSSDDLARSYTLLSYYQPFSSEALISDCLAMMRGDSVAHLKYRLGLLTSRFRANHPLKACKACMEQNRAETGWAYWHLEHQYPGVWFCERHGEPLHESIVKSTGVSRFLWSLPDECELRLSWKQDADIPQGLKKLASLTLAIFRVNREPGWLEGRQVVPVLREAIKQRGWMTANGSLRTSEIAPSYLSWCQTLRGPLELSSLPDSEQDAVSQIGRLLRPWRTGTHPLRMVVAICWLFETFDAFTAAYDALPEVSFANMDLIRAAQATDAESIKESASRKSALVKLLQGGMSATAAANAMGLTVGTAMAWAAQNGIAVPKRPKQFNAEIQVSLRADLRIGMDKQTAAENNSISVQTVTRFLRTEPGLYEAWELAAFRKKQALARSSWNKSLKSHGHLGTNWLRAQDPQIYGWLYRNDRAWLQGNLPQPVARSAQSALNWDERDLALSSLAEKALAELKANHPDKAVQLWQLYQVMPQLKAKLSALDRLPLTRRVIERGLGRSKGKATKVLL